MFAALKSLFRPRGWSADQQRRARELEGANTLEDDATSESEAERQSRKLSGDVSIAGAGAELSGEHGRSETEEALRRASQRRA